jgi:tetratricopeptide (TPR) repeat protein
VDVSPNNEWANLYLGQELVFGQNNVIKGLPFLQKSYDLGGNRRGNFVLPIGYAYFWIGEYPKALKYIKETLSLELWCGMVQDYYNILYVQGNYNGALNFLDSIQNYTPCESSCDLMRFYYYTSKRDFKKAEIYYKKVLDTGTAQRKWELDYYSANFNYFLKETGRKNEALKGLNSSVKYFETDILKVHGVDLARDRLQLAASYAMLGENEKALDYLSQLEKYGLFEYPITLSFPGFDNLRNDPEFKAIVKRIEDQRAAVREKVREMEQSGELHL